MPIDNIIRVSVTGPESSGKTTLANDLHEIFGSGLVEEYARMHLNHNGKAYSQKDLLEIAKRQIAMEREAVESVRKKNVDSNKFSFVFFDTDLYVLKIWSELAFGSCESFILDHLAQDSYDLHLLCKPDIAWEFDELREHPEPHQREFIYHHYLDALQQQPKPWFEIIGQGPERLALAEKKIRFLRFSYE